MTATPEDSSGRQSGDGSGTHMGTDTGPPARPSPADVHPLSAALTDEVAPAAGTALAAPQDTRRWPLWSQPASQVAYILGFELVALVWLSVASTSFELPHRQDWQIFGLLMICAGAHNYLSRREEDRRRRQSPTVHIDLTAIWSFPAVLVLPIQLAVVLIVVLRAQLWIVGRRPLYKFAFSTTSIALSALAARGTLDLFGESIWLTAGQLDPAWAFLAFAVAGVVYGVAQALLVAGALTLGSASPTLRSVFGSRQDNGLEAVTIALGIVTALVVIAMPAASVIMLLVSVLGNRIAEVRQLRVDIRTDPKTGLRNMVGWREAAERVFARTERAGGNFTLLMIDLDHFKSINDTWRHAAGDDVLQMVARAISQVTRPTDIIGRFGGEEFLALLPDTDTNQARNAAERIRRAVMELQVVTTGKSGRRATIYGRTTSIGLATYPHHATSLPSLLRAADAAVYEAKGNGRNLVRVASASS